MNGAPQTPTIARPLVKAGDDFTHALGAGDRVELAGLAQPRRRIEVVVGAQRDDEHIRFVYGPVGRDAPRLGVDGDDLLPQEPYAGLGEVVVAKPNLLGLGAAEHDVELREPEDERFTRVDQSDAGFVAEPLREDRRQLEPGEARSENEYS